jgi:hypothetical protein
MTARKSFGTLLHRGAADQRATLPSALLVIACVAVSVGLGVLATSAHAVELTGAIALVTILSTLTWRFGIGLWLALLVLGAIDALPGPELETIETPIVHLYVSDTLIIVLILVLLADNCLNGFRHLADTRIRRVLSLWSVALLLLWIVTVTRSYAWDEITLRHAMEFGRDFGFFAFLVPLFAATFARERVRRVTLAVLAIGIGVAEIAEIVSVLTHKSVSFLVHTVRTTEENGLTRLYVNAQYLAVVAAMLGVGLVLFARDRRMRLLGTVIAVLSLVSVTLELTRAQYIGGAVGLAAALLIWLVFNRRAAGFGRQRLTRLILILAVFAGLVVVVHPAQLDSGVIGKVGERFSSVFSTLSSGNSTTSTVAYREVEASQLEQVLGSHWVFGLGFLDPRNHYVLGLRNGSIRNGDVGVLNAVMTMGLIGAFLIYFPLVFILLGLIRRATTGSERRSDSWIAFGVAAWIVSALTSSITLVSLFSSPGLCIAAVALAVGATCQNRAYSREDEGIAAQTSHPARRRQQPPTPIPPRGAGWMTT